MRFLQITILLAACMAFISPLSSEEPEVHRYDANARTRIQFAIENRPDPIFPPALKQRGVFKGKAVFAVFVNQFGELADYLLIEASHLEFASSVERVIDRWKFSVPYADGEPAPVASRLVINFRLDGVVYETTGFHLVLPFGNDILTDDEYRIYGVWELDKVPEPIEIAKPEFHVDLLEEREQVNAIFDFFIDTEGRVRIPTLREADDKVDERLLVIAQDALIKWRFNTPTVDGKPVVSRVAQPFRFKNKNGVGVVK
ncbi:hypothetical protein [Pelagicoccus sp. SDUM812003]|uniref:hypothetical protein n=1 Tax=Pelagicoccus sp. SDUM812003 TaxID=3041267 RepID=UPI00280E44E6|nr:hypothetical protein [Pelagicoccus sp. SDUM812003]MDQ8204539.1 hypothetical protein [Pelagicoccus sp. SDUM812003]